jgi:predicted RNase H-like HicB family nuclease
MEYDILLTKQSNNGYIAQALLMPEIIVSGENEAEALTRVSKAIANRHTQSRIVRITVPIPDEPSDDPWFRFAGMWGDEATWQQFEEDIQTFRRIIDEQTQAKDEA